VLIVINELNRGGGGLLPTPTPNFRPPPFYNANGDGFLTSNDALIIINFLNTTVFPGGEGEGTAFQDALVSDEPVKASDAFAVSTAPGYFEVRLPEREAEGVEASLRGELTTRKSVDRIMADIDDALSPAVTPVKKAAETSHDRTRMESTLDEIAGDLNDRFYDRDASDSIF